VPVQQPGRRVIGLAPGQCAADGGPYRLLIVEDDEANRQVLVKLLQPLGFELREAADGHEALRIWEKWQPHLIWMDMRLPLLDGHAATRHIKATPQGRNTIIIALTASAFEGDRAAMLAEGCDDFVDKPYYEAKIFEMLQKHLGLRFVYEEAGESRENGAIDRHTEAQDIRTAVRAVPLELLGRLKEALIRLDVEAIDGVIEEIRAPLPLLAHELSALAADFRYDEISSLIQATEEGDYD
jgi:CheY-like chemotaxis protein